MSLSFLLLENILTPMNLDFPVTLLLRADTMMASTAYFIGIQHLTIVINPVLELFVLN